MRDRWEVNKEASLRRASRAQAEKPDSSHRQSSKSYNFAGKPGNYSPLITPTAKILMEIEGTKILIEIKGEQYLWMRVLSIEVLTSNDESKYCQFH